MSRNHKVKVIYGGTFDPFHKGHEAIANSILSHPNVTELRLIPCAIPALKEQATVSGESRLGMLNAWREQQTDCERIVIDPLEMNRSGPSYTVDTVIALQTQFPDDHWVFALGTDAWNSLASWSRVGELRQRVAFWIFTRSGERPAADFADVSRVDSLDDLVASGAGHSFLDSDVSIPLASTELRQNVENLQRQTPQAIYDYIMKHGLYSTTAG